MLIIFSVILILVLIARVSLPLFLSPQAELYATNRPVDAAGIKAVGMDEYLETGYFIDTAGEVRFFNIADGSELDRSRLTGPDGEQALVSVQSYGRLNHVLLWKDGSLTVEQVKFSPFFDLADNNRRRIVHQLVQRAAFPVPAAGRPLQALALARVNDDGRQTRVNLYPDNRLQLQIRAVTENLLGEEEVSSAEHELEVNALGRITALALSNDGLQLYAGTDQGELLRWDLSDDEEPSLLETLQAFTDRRAITALALVFGDVSLAVGDDKGQVSTWFPVRDEAGVRKLTRIHNLSNHAGPVRSLSPSTRDKTVISSAADGLTLDYMTSERFLLALGVGDKLQNYNMTTRGNALIALTADGRLLSWKLDIPHPEISLKTLFGKVWYEGYDEPTYAWQSSSASDDYEPKLSLTPLIYGTLKGTFYAMLFAVPLAIFAAIYTSQFARPRLREGIKPAVEIMAAIPTVIIGFLAALWLAPLIERSLGSLFLSLILVPAALMLSILLWQAMRKFEPLKRVERGFEFIAVAPVVIMAIAIAALLGPGMENWLFAGDLKQWLFTEMGTRYDPRNCIIIAFAMGFAVIPIIFTIAEDALSNVPASLKAASLALGASRWQTVWRVILPSASPGIFAGTMIGFGRAVGETMIVLMATGNTAIMDLSIFNGMRPLSANIAVEIPEAPVDGTLYRTLFLSAVILFVMTFIVNTVAEIVRQRLRAKYGRF
ncbi:MAG: ABC transporter permease subunit [Deltaproteobacteria bacterium]|nr:ABC transporter permease subunit [Deltaproteobacteria bacterium]